MFYIITFGKNKLIIQIFSVRLSHDDSPCTNDNENDHAVQPCFDYQFRSDDSQINMTIGTIFGNSQKGGCRGCQNKDWGDCMICSRYDSNDPTYKVGMGRVNFSPLGSGFGCFDFAWVR